MMKDYSINSISWMVSLRWLAIGAQLIALVFGVKLGYVIESDIRLYLGCVSTLVIFNFSFIWKRFITYQSVLLHCLIDLGAFTTLIILSSKMHNPLWKLIYLHAAIAALLTNKVQGRIYFVALISLMALVQSLSYSYYFAVIYTMLPQWIILIATWFLTKAVSRLINTQSTRLHELEAKEANSKKVKSIGAVSAGIIHELGTPMNTMRLKVDKIKSLINEKNVKEQINVIDQALLQCEQTMTKLNSVQIDEVLDNLKLYDLKKTTEEIITKIGSENSSINNLEIKYNHTTKNTDCFFCSAHLEMVIKVILENITDLNLTTVNIETFQHQKYVELQIRDQGEGFDDFIINNFSSPFISSKGRGHGLGLFSSLNTLEAMNGKLDIFNDNGAVVSVKLPREFNV